LRRGLGMRCTILGAEASGDLTIDGRRGALAYESILDALARVEPHRSASTPAATRDLGATRSNERRVLICAGDRVAGDFDAVVDADARDMDLWFESPYERLGVVRRV